MKKKAEENIAEYPVHMETRVALLEQSIGHINQTLIEIKKDFKEGLTYNGSEIRRLREEVKSDHRWMFGLMIAGFTGMFGVMAHGFHWF